MKAIVPTLALAALYLLGLAGCGPDQAGPSPEAERKILAREIHKLTWRNYDGRGDASAAVFILDGVELGRGAAGFTALKRLIAKMPKRSVVNLGIYYHGDLKYPFKPIELSTHAAKYGVFIGVPKGG